MAFKLGDLVVFNKAAEINENPISPTNKRYMDNNQVFTVIREPWNDGENALVRVKTVDGEIEKTHTYYVARLMLLDQEIKEGMFVRCVDRRRSSIVEQGNLYKVISVSQKEGRKYVRVASITREINANYPIEMFAFYSAKEPEQFIKQIDPVDVKFLKELAHGGIHSSLCSFAIMYEGGEKAFHRNAPCHAAFRPNGKGKISSIALCFSRHVAEGAVPYKAHSKEGYARFLHYIVNESPFKDCFIRRDGKDMVEDGVLMNVEKTNDEIAAAAIATRHYTEYPAKAKVFDEVMDMGFDGNVAIIVSTFFDKKTDGSMRFNNFHGAHHFMDAIREYEALFKFFKDSFDPALIDNKPVKNGFSGYKVSSSLAPMTNNDEKSIKGFVTKMKGIGEVSSGIYGGNSPGFVGKNAIVRVCASFSKVV